MHYQTPYYAGYCGCQDESFSPYGHIPYKSNHLQFALILVLFILLVIIGLANA